MYNIKSKKDLETAIMLLENEVEIKKGLLADQYGLIYKSFSPANIVKVLLKEVATPDRLKSNFLDAAIGISTGYFLKKLFFKKSKNPLKKLFGNLLQYGVAILLFNQKGTLKTILALFQKFFDVKEPDSKTSTNENSKPDSETN
jgi:hypothetical protein